MTVSKKIIMTKLWGLLPEVRLRICSKGKTMNKADAIGDAQKKAKLSKQPQAVFRYITGIIVRYDYTFQHLWDRRRHKQPPATMVTTVTSATTSTD